jgi:hypothetical protein
MAVKVPMITITPERVLKIWVAIRSVVVHLVVTLRFFVDKSSSLFILRFLSIKRVVKMYLIGIVCARGSL